MNKDIVEFIKSAVETQSLIKLQILDNAIKTLNPIGFTDIEKMISEIETLDSKQIEVLSKLVCKIQAEDKRSQGLSSKTIEKLKQYVEVEYYFI